MLCRQSMHCSAQIPPSPTSGLTESRGERGRSQVLERESITAERQTVRNQTDLFRVRVRIVATGVCFDFDRSLNQLWSLQSPMLLPSEPWTKATKGICSGVEGV